MFKYTKRLISDIQFWCQELKIRAKENDELDRITDITFQEGYSGHNSMAGFGYYMTMQRNRADRKRFHKEQLAAIR